jgi:hypothetical protein
MPFAFNQDNLKRAKEIISRYPAQYKKGFSLLLLLINMIRSNHAIVGLGATPIRIYIYQCYELCSQIIGNSSNESI